MNVDDATNKTNAGNLSNELQKIDADDEFPDERTDQRNPPSKRKAPGDTKSYVNELNLAFVVNQQLPCVAKSATCLPPDSDKNCTSIA